MVKARNDATLPPTVAAYCVVGTFFGDESIISVRGKKGERGKVVKNCVSASEHVPSEGKKIEKRKKKGGKLNGKNKTKKRSNETRESFVGCFRWAIVARRKEISNDGMLHM